MKQYLRDKGVVRLCDGNVARMNIMELLYYERRRIAEDVLDLWQDTVELLPSLCMLLFAPVAFPVAAWYRIREAKKEVARCEQRRVD